MVFWLDVTCSLSQVTEYSEVRTVFQEIRHNKLTSISSVAFIAEISMAHDKLRTFEMIFGRSEDSRVRFGGVTSVHALMLWEAGFYFKAR